MKKLLFCATLVAGCSVFSAHGMSQERKLSKREINVFFMQYQWFKQEIGQDNLSPKEKELMLGMLSAKVVGLPKKIGVVVESELSDLAAHLQDALPRANSHNGGVQLPKPGIRRLKPIVKKQQ